jgi:hypothetical protein
VYLSKDVHHIVGRGLVKVSLLNKNKSLYEAGVAEDVHKVADMYCARGWPMVSACNVTTSMDHTLI